MGLKSLSTFTRSLFFLFSLSSALAFTAPVNFTTLAFDDGFSPLFGDGNLQRSQDGRRVRLLLDESTGSGFISQDLYMHGYFSADIKLPSDYTAGVVVAFYTSNGDIFEKNHDELDFEFLGNIRGKDWRIQTNVYGNGSTSRGREERYNLWFDPTNGFHRYSILWTQKHIIFYIDSVPIREVVRTPAMGGDYPSKPMSVYATIWDGSNWATNGGRYKANYKYAPFTAEFSNLVLKGRPSDPIEQISAKSSESGDSFGENTELAHAQRLSMNGVRHRHMTYSYCYDRARYPEPPSECVVIPSEQKRFKDTGRVKFGNGHRRHGKRRTRNPMSESDHKSASI